MKHWFEFVRVFTEGVFDEDAFRIWLLDDL